MKKLKVLQIIDSTDIGGAEMLAVNIANKLAYEKVESHIVITRKEGILHTKLDKKVKYLFLNRTKIIDFTAIFKLKNYIAKEKIQIIHAHSTSHFIAVCVKLLLPKITIVWHNHHGNYVNLKGKKLFIIKIISFFINTIINVNEDLNDWTIKKLYSKNNYYLKNFPHFLEVENKTILKGVKNKRIVCLASFRPQKDHINLLEAFELFLKKNPGWTLHLVGEYKNDAYSARVFDFIKNHNLEEHVFAYGPCMDVKNILDQSSIGTLSSSFEGLPVSLLEYGLAKLPVAITNVGQSGNILNKINPLFLCPKANSQALSEVYTTISNFSDEEREFYGEKFRNHVLKEYSVDEFIKTIIKIYSLC